MGQRRETWNGEQNGSFCASVLAKELLYFEKWAHETAWMEEKELIGKTPWPRKEDRKGHEDEKHPRRAMWSKRRNRLAQGMRPWPLWKTQATMGHRQHLRPLFLLNLFVLSLCKLISTKRDASTYEAPKNVLSSQILVYFGLTQATRGNGLRSLLQCKVVSFLPLIS